MYDIIHRYKIFKTVLKLSRSSAIFEFSSLNSNISLNVIYECRRMQLYPHRISLTNLFAFAVVVTKQLTELKGNDCVERDLKDPSIIGAPFCTTSVEGEKCSSYYQLPKLHKGFFQAIRDTGLNNYLNTYEKTIL